MAKSLKKYVGKFIQFRYSVPEAEYIAKVITATNGRVKLQSPEGLEYWDRTYDIIVLKELKGEA